MPFIEGSYDQVWSQLPISLFHGRTADRLRVLLQPNVENCPEHRISLFGAEYLQPALEAIDKGMPVTIEVGMNSRIAPTPAWLAYLEIGVQRLIELYNVGVIGRLRFFSTASLQTDQDPQKQRRKQYFQNQQAKLAKQYLRLFHPGLIEDIDLGGLTQILDLPPNIEELEKEARTTLNQETIQSFEAMSKNHGEKDAPISSLQYALMHNDSRTFGDDPINKGQRIAVGCASERPFNESRHKLHEPKAEIPGISIAVLGVLSKTPPYLDRRMRNGAEQWRLFGPTDAAVSFKELAWAFETCLGYNPGSLDIDHVLKTVHRSKYDGVPGILELRYLWRCFPVYMRPVLVDFISNNQNRQKGYDYI